MCGFCWRFHAFDTGTAQKILRRISNNVAHYDSRRRTSLRSWRAYINSTWLVDWTFILAQSWRAYYIATWLIDWLENYIIPVLPCLVTIIPPPDWLIGHLHKPSLGVPTDWLIDWLENYIIPVLPCLLYRNLIGWLETSLIPVAPWVSISRLKSSTLRSLLFGHIYSWLYKFWSLWQL